MKAKTFKDAYDVLQRHARTLREQDEPNIDDLLRLVTESVSAYQLCQLRLDAVEQALEKTLGGAAGTNQVTTSVPAAIFLSVPTTHQKGDDA